jgi:hypothetical protein
MQTICLNLPQTLRIRLQEYQNAQGIEQPDTAIVAILQAYLDSLPAAEHPKLPAMYDAEDGPCEVIPSFLEPSAQTKAC